MVDKTSIKFRLARMYITDAENFSEVRTLSRSADILTANYEHLLRKVNPDFVPVEQIPSNSEEAGPVVEDPVRIDPFVESLFAEEPVVGEFAVNDPVVESPVIEQVPSASTSVQVTDKELHIFKLANGRKYISTDELDPLIAQEHPMNFPTFKQAQPTINKISMKIHFEAKTACVDLTIEATLMTTTFFSVFFYVYKDQKNSAPTWSQSIKCRNSPSGKTTFNGQIRINDDRLFQNQKLLFMSIKSFTSMTPSGFSLPFAIHLGDQHTSTCDYKARYKQAMCKQET